MKYGFWLPIFGGWLRNVSDEQMTPSFDSAKKGNSSSRGMGIGYYANC
jgi:FMNH2-dependent dimethyl sulfone monooxygenase